MTTTTITRTGNGAGHRPGDQAARSRWAARRAATRTARRASRPSCHASCCSRVPPPWSGSAYDALIAAHVEWQRGHRSGSPPV
jgi:hypothetical protein